jgi:hypothetical protein
MRNPMYNKKHLKEYFIYGLICAIAYIIPVLYFLYDNKYENFYFIYIGNVLFMFGVFLYVKKLLPRPYEGRKSVTMMVEGIFTTIVGVVISSILLLLSIFLYFPTMLPMAANRVIANAPETIQTNHPTDLFLMILINTIIANFSVGAFIAALIAYVGKRDQRDDKTESLDVDVPRKEVKYNK